MVQEGILSARAVLPGGTGQSVMCVVNLTDRDYTMKVGDLIATAAEVNARKPAESETTIRTRVGGVTMQPGPINGAHVQEIIDSLPTSLSAAQHQKSKEFILSQADIFSSSEFDLGRVDLVQHTIDTGENRPFKQKLRRHPMGQ